MRKPFYKIVDGTEAVASILYRLNDLILIDPEIPSSYFRDGLDLWAREKRRNLGDRIPQIAPLPDGDWTPALFASDSRKTILTVPDRLPLLTALLKEIPAGQKPISILAASEKGIFPEAETEENVLVSASLQEAADFTAIAEMSVSEGTGPVIHLFDADRFPREIQKIDCLSDDDLRGLVGGKKGGDLAASLARFAEWSGRFYHPIDYEGDPEAEKVVVTMGPVSGDIRRAVHFLNENRKERVGFVRVAQISPFDRKAMVEKIPGPVRTLFVPDCADLYFKVMDAIHEGLLNGWSWFATLPKLSKVKRGRDVAGRIFPDLPPNDRYLEVRIDDVGPDGLIPLIRLLVNLLAEPFFGQAYFATDPKEKERTTIHLRFSPEPILSNEEVIHPLPIPPLDADLAARSIGPEAQPATISATAVLETILKAATEKGLLSDSDLFRRKWWESLEEHFRPLGPFFVLQNRQAVERTAPLLQTPETSSRRKSHASPPKADRPSLQSPIEIGRTTFRSRIVSILDDFPRDQGELPFASNPNVGALLLPLIRETEIRDTARRYYQQYSRGLLPQNFRVSPSNRSLGLSPFLEGISKIRESAKLPLIARLSAQIIDSWVGFGVDLQEAGTALLEIFFEEQTSGGNSGDRAEVVRRLKKALKIPVLIAFSPFEGEILPEVSALQEAGADGFVLFHEVFQRDLDPETGIWSESKVKAGNDHRLRTLDWIRRLSGKIDLPIIAHGGLATENDALKALSAGAAWVQVETNDKFPRAKNE